MARVVIVALVFLSRVVCARDLDSLYEKSKLKVGAKIISAYIADTERGRSEGLMFIKSLGENEGMLFVFEDESPRAFWMKNTLIPLSIGFFSAAGELIDVQEMKVASSLLATNIPTYQSRGAAAFALEMSPNWFEKHKIKMKSKLQLVAPVKSELLKKRLHSSAVTRP